MLLARYVSRRQMQLCARIGDDFSRSFVRALNIGGMVWEGQEQSAYATIDEMLRALEAALAEWLREPLVES